MLQLFVLLLALLTAGNADPIKARARDRKDTPFSNFTFKMNEVPGECHPIKAMKISQDKSAYEGRWYGAYLGFSEEQQNTINCFVWDTFFDKNGHFHNFLSYLEDGKERVCRVVGTPIDEANGIYEIKSDCKENKTLEIIVNTFYYTDSDVQGFWYTECQLGQNKHTEQLSIGVRHLEDLEKNKAKIDQIYKHLEEKGGTTRRELTKHENCKYPPMVKYTPMVECPPMVKYPPMVKHPYTD